MSASHLRGLRGQLDPVLTNLALGYKQADFIAEKIFPVVFTEKEGVRVPVFGKGSFVEYQTERAVGAASNVITLDSPSFMAGTELAKITASGGQLGVARKDLPKFTETIAKMSVAFDMAADQAGDSMAKLANVYQIPIDQIGKLGDAVNHLSNSSPAKAGDIINTLGRVGGVAKEVV